VERGSREPPRSDPPPFPQLSCEELWDQGNGSWECPHRFTGNDLAPPRFLTAPFIDVELVTWVSRFRAAAGHDMPDSFESCRSMKHYFLPGKGEGTRNPENRNVTLYAPADGIITLVREEHVAYGKQVMFSVKGVVGATVRMFHVDLLPGVGQGTRLRAGEPIGRVVPGAATDIMVELYLGEDKKRAVSYFDVMTDEVFAPYAALGHVRSDFVVPREVRDAWPFECEGEAFVEVDPEAIHWVTLGEAPADRHGQPHKPGRLTKEIHDCRKTRWPMEAAWECVGVYDGPLDPVPRFLTHNPIDLSPLRYVSRYEPRPSAGEVAVSGECASERHFFFPNPGPATVVAPMEGTVMAIRDLSEGRGSEVVFAPRTPVGVVLTFSGIEPHEGLAQGTKLRPLERIGTGLEGASISALVTFLTPEGPRNVSLIEAFTDEGYWQYAWLGRDRAEFRMPLEGDASAEAGCDGAFLSDVTGPRWVSLW